MSDPTDIVMRLRTRQEWAAWAESERMKAAMTTMERERSQEIHTSTDIALVVMVVAVPVLIAAAIAFGLEVLG